jgi:CheY-like chemotaxis protein
VRRLRAIDPTVRAIVSSGYAMDPVMAKFRDHGFCAMIAKPYEIAALARVVAEVLAENVIAHDFANRKTA